MKSGYLSEIFVSFQGEGAHVGRRHLFVRLAGCNIRCTYCDTPDSLERTPRYAVHWSPDRTTHGANPISAAELHQIVVSMLVQEAPIDALALTGGEPLAQADFLAEFLGRGPLSVPVLLETNGVLSHRLPEVLPWIDIISMDIKLPSNSHERPFWEEHTAFLALSRAKDLYVKILVDQDTAESEVKQAAALLAPIEPAVAAFIQPIVDARGTPQLDANRLTELFLVARRQHPSVRVLPQTHKLMGLR